MLRRGLCLAAIVVALSASTSVGARPRHTDGEVHRVARGQVLGSIARRYGVTVNDLCRANGIDSKATLREGQRLLVPSAPDAAPEKGSPERIRAEAAPSGASWAPYMKPAWRRGYITIAGHGREWSGYVIGPKERVLAGAQQQISRVLASWRTGKRVDIDDRLIRLLAHVSDVFGGRMIRVVGGYREQSHARHSKHFSGDALDFSIPGIPNDVLRDYLRTLPNVGVGYYPNSTHVHLDVRQGKRYWEDLSRPGQKPAYRGTVAATERRR